MPLTTSPMDPITTTSIQAPSDNPILSLISQLQNQAKGSVVPDNPFAQLGSMLSGFAAGTQGRENPVLKQFIEQRDLEMRRQREAITLTLAAQREQREQAEHADTRKFRNLQLGISNAKARWEMSKDLNDPVGLKQSIGEFSKLTGTPLSDEALEAAVKSHVLQEGIRRSGDMGLVASMLGMESWPGYNKELNTYVKNNPDMEPVLASAFKLPPDWRDLPEKMRVARRERVFKEAQIGAKERMAAGTATPEDIALNALDNSKTAALFAYAQKGKRQLSPGEQSLVKFELEGLEQTLKAGRMMEKIREIDLDTKKAKLGAFPITTLAASVEMLQDIINMVTDPLRRDLDEVTKEAILRDARTLQIRVMTDFINETKKIQQREQKQSPTGVIKLPNLAK